MYALSKGSGCDAPFTLSTMPFAKLLELKTLDYNHTSSVMTELQKFTAMEEFYTNVNNCLGYTLEFMVDNTNFLMKDPKSGNTLRSVLISLKNIVSRTGDAAQASECFSGNKDRILITLNNVMESCQENYVKAEAGKVVSTFLAMNNLDVSEWKNLLHLASKSFIVLDRENAFLELAGLTSIFLKRGIINAKPIMKWMDTKCIDYLKTASEYTDLEHANEKPTILELLKCILIYYQTRDDTISSQNVVANHLKSILSYLCKFVCNPLLRNTSEQLLTYLVYELYYTYAIPYAETDISSQIQILPDNFEDWPGSNANMFFVLAYLQLQNSHCLWRSDVILEAINSYFSVHVLVPPIVIKALAWLYPLLSSDICNFDCSMGKRLLATLRTYRSLSPLLMYDTVQMAWLLKNADSGFRTRLIMIWLQVKSDGEILEILNTTSTGHLFVEFLVSCSNSAITERVLGLITQLQTYPDLTNAIAITSPLFCNRPTIYSLLLRMKPMVSSNSIDTLTSIKIVSASLPFLANDEAIQAACSYSVSLIETMKDQPKAVMSFCHFPATIRFLIATSASLEDSTAITAIALLKQLVTAQMHSGISVNVSLPINFCNVLRGSSDRLNIGLKLLLLTLSMKQAFVLHCTKCSLSGLYHLLCNLLEQKKETVSVLNALKLLIVREPSLSFSLATSYCLRVICISSMDLICSKPFLEFLEAWLKRATQILYTDIPSDLLRAFLLQLRDYEKYCVSINRLLDKYEQNRW